MQDTARITLRLPQGDRGVLELASFAEGASLSAFVRNAALCAAWEKLGLPSEPPRQAESEEGR